MAVKREPGHPTFRPLNPDAYVVESFDVTSVIGTVHLTDGGSVRPHVAAFMLIAEQDAPGVFEFPMPDGGTCVVAVSYLDPPGLDRHTDLHDPC